MTPACPRRLAELRRTIETWPWTAPLPTAELIVAETNRRAAALDDDAERLALTVTVDDYRALLATP